MTAGADTIAKVGPPATAPPSSWHRYDLMVLVVAAALLVCGAMVYRGMTRPDMVEFSQDGLRFLRPTGYFPPEDVPPPPRALAGLDGLASDAATREAPAPPRTHKRYKTPEGPLIALEVLIDRPPEYRGLAIVLQQDRRARYGEYLWNASSSERDLSGVQWLRTEFQYAIKATEGDAPQVATGIEYATLNASGLYVVTVHGTEAEARRLESLVLSTLTVESKR